MPKEIKTYVNTNSRKALVTIAIGKEYLEKWEKNVLPTWILYAKNHDLSIVAVIDDLLPKNDPSYKKATWQKLIIPQYFISKDLNYELIAYLDSDILINPLAPDIFNFCDMGKINSTSLRFHLPYDYNKTLRKIALLRKTYIDKDYPLDSGMFIELDKLYEYHNLIPQKDEFCAGLLVFSVDIYSDFMAKCFKQYTANVKSITNGGDQTHLNFHFQESGFFNRIDYKWQAIWSYEVVNNYPFLFQNKFKDLSLLNDCIKTVLFNNFFLHFAGNWPESTIWSNSEFNLTMEEIDFYKKLKNYEQEKLSGKPVGMVKAHVH